MIELIFIATTIKLAQKFLRISSSFLIIFIWTGSLLFHQTLMLLWYLYITNFLVTFLDAIWFYTGTGDDQRCIPVHLVASKLELPICRLLPAMHAISGVTPPVICSQTGNITTFQTLKKQAAQTRRTDRYDRLREFPSLS